LPSTVTFLSASATQGSCTNAGGLVTCSLNNLNNGGSVVVTVRGKTTIEGSVTNRATVTASQADPNLADNATTAVATVNPQAEVSIVTFGSPDPITISNKLSYIVFVNNAGPSTATGLQVIDFLPGELAFIDATNTHGTAMFEDGAVTCSIPSLPKGGRATITIALSPPLMEGMLTNAASVSVTQRDPILRNNFYAFISRVSILPAVALKLAGTNVVLSWPTSTGPFNLQSATSLSPANWQAVTNVPAVIDSQNVVTQRMSATLRLYRLIK
jgi:uncharacterized repeat protein (TIGR01451 family)